MAVGEGGGTEGNGKRGRIGEGRDTARPALEKGDPGHHWVEKGSEAGG